MRTASAWVIGAAIVAWWPAPAGHPDPCIEMRNPQARLNRTQLAWVTSLREPIPVHQLIGAIGVPYCKLNDGFWNNLPREDSAYPAERLAYPLESDPTTFLVVFIDKRYGDYRAYSFSFHHDGVF
jgi:hypothetical protein